ncbi:MAG: hypothetical protein WBH98_05355 [Bacteroidales bacterium]
MDNFFSVSVVFSRTRNNESDSRINELLDTKENENEDFSKKNITARKQKILLLSLIAPQTRITLQI